MAAPPGTFYSLWLRPASQTQTEFLQNLIAYQANSKAGASNAFPPHATLFSFSSEKLASIELEEVLRKTNDAIDAFCKATNRKRGGKLALESLGPQKRDLFFQCVLLKLSPNEDLLALRKAVCDAFDSPEMVDTYFPHLSLVYGNLDADYREAMVKEIEGRWKDETHGTIEVDRAEIWVNTKAEIVEGWRMVGCVAL